MRFALSGLLLVSLASARLLTCDRPGVVTFGKALGSFTSFVISYSYTVRKDRIWSKEFMANNGHASRYPGCDRIHGVDNGELQTYPDGVAAIFDHAMLLSSHLTVEMVRRKHHSLYQCLLSQGITVVGLLHVRRVLLPTRSILCHLSEELQ